MEATRKEEAKEIDAELAALYTAAAKAEQHVAWTTQTILGAAGAKYYYRGRNYVTDMKLDEALPLVQAKLDENGSGYTLMGAYTIRHYEDEGVIAKLAEEQAEVARIWSEIARINARYDGWSRFFLVTSSKGHIHSSMNCSTCRPTTTYGWLPGLSGESEADAVAAHGEVLCSVCFPSAPVAWTLGKLTKAQAEKAAA